jgi:uncharacterized membrane protein
VDYFVDALGFVVLSLIPTFETRYTIPLAVAQGWSPLVAWCLGATTTIALAVALAYFLWLGDSIARRLPIVKDLWAKYVESARKRLHPYVQRWGVFGLAIFVAIPLPGTGVWTGSIAGYFLGMNEKEIAISTITGGVIANTITLLTAIGVLSVI